MKWLSKLQYLLIFLGVVMVGLYLGARVHQAVYSRAALESFKAERVHATPPGASGEMSAAAPDFSLWSEKRIREYQESLVTHSGSAIAVLRIPKLRLEVPVLEGTDDLTLNRGVGRIEGTAKPGEHGNIGIAGHRDGFFRGLKDIGPGDTIEMVTPTRKTLYTVDRIVIVTPNDVSVLKPQQQPSLTLVTCYPFYFIGSAPQRYIVQASMNDSDGAFPQAVEPAKFSASTAPPR